MAGRRNPSRYGVQKWKALQKLDVGVRSDWLCEFERSWETFPNAIDRAIKALDPKSYRPSEVRWERCRRRVEGFDAGMAHIFRRWKNGMIETDDGFPLKFHPLAVIAGCGDCHRKFDSRQHADRVRIPPYAEERARLLIEHTLAAARARGEVAIDVDLSHV